MLQVSSSSGAPYTIYLDLPSSNLGKSAATQEDKPVESAQPDQHGDTEVEQPTAPSTESTSFTHSASSLGQMFCPCPGFAYQSLLTDKAEMVSHRLQLSN